MKITLKNVQQESFTVEIDPSKTILDLKILMKEILGDDIKAENLELIFNGAVLDNSALISSYDIKESSAVVFLKKRNLHTAEERGEEQGEESAEKLVEESVEEHGSEQPNEQRGEPQADLHGTTPKKIEDSPKDTTESSTRTEVVPDSQQNQSHSQQVSISGGDYSHDHPSLLVVGQNRPEDIYRLLLGLGFSHETIESALTLNDNDPFRTIEYLIDTIENIDSLSGSESPSVDFSLDNFDLEGIMSELEPDQIEAINRLHALGYPIEEVVQVYLACGGNEELAAEILSSNRDD